MAEQLQAGEEQAVITELSRVRQFQEALTEVGTVQPVDIPLYMDSLNPVHDASRQFLQYGRENVGPTLYVDSSEPWLAAASTGTVRFTPRRARGGHHSAHGVFFGDLITDGVEGSIPVAVKPHYDSPEESCVGDYLSYAAARSADVPTLQPVGFLLSHSGDTAYSLTRLESELTTLDSVAWEGMDAGSDLASVWGQVARQVALLHAAGMAGHGDLAARNIGIKPDGGAAILLDWERARLSMATPRDSEAHFGVTYPDLKSLLESMVHPPNHKFNAGIGLIDFRSDNAWSIFSELVFNEYIDMRMGHAKQHEQAAVDEELLELENSLKAHMGLVVRDLRQAELAVQPA